MRQIVLDTETTGLDPEAGHRVIEIGCLELVNRRPTGQTFHRYLRPDREIDAGAIGVHGLTNEFLADKPRFRDVCAEFLDFVRDAELVIHNAAFDVGFLDNELKLMHGADAGKPLCLRDSCAVLDTLALARKMHPGQRNSLDALCNRYSVDNSHRELHGALLDAQILAEVYLLMTGGQKALSLDADAADAASNGNVDAPLQCAGLNLTVVRASAAELENHQVRLATIDKASDGNCLWQKLDEDQGP